LGAHASLLLDAVPADLQDPVLALSLSRRSVELTHWSNSIWINPLALAECRNGQLDASRETMAKALELISLDEPAMRND